MLRRAQQVMRIVMRPLCQHRYRPSRSWPGFKVCERCGRRALGDI